MTDVGSPQRQTLLDVSIHSIAFSPGTKRPYSLDGLHNSWSHCPRIWENWRLNQSIKIYLCFLPIVPTQSTMSWRKKVISADETMTNVSYETVNKDSGTRWMFDWLNLTSTPVPALACCIDNLYQLLVGDGNGVDLFYNPCSICLSCVLDHLFTISN